MTRSRGFTLIELIVSVAITAILMLGLSAFFANAFHNIVITQQNTQASAQPFVMSAIVNDKLSHIKTILQGGNNKASSIVFQSSQAGHVPFSTIRLSNKQLAYKDFVLFNGIKGNEYIDSGAGTINVIDGAAVFGDVKNGSSFTKMNGNDYYVVFPLTNEIKKCPLGQGCSAFVSTGLLKPTDITTDGVNLYATDSGNNRVVKIDGGGTVTEIASGFNFPTGIAYYNNVPKNKEFLFVSDTLANQVKKIDLKDSNKVSVVSGAGENALCQKTSALYCKLNLPTGLHVEANTDLYIADSGNGRVLKVKDPGEITINQVPIILDYSYLPNGSIDLRDIQLIFDPLVELPPNLQAENLNPNIALHKGAYEVKNKNEFLFKYFTQLVAPVAPIACLPLGNFCPYTSIQVTDDWSYDPTLGEGISIDGDSFSITSIEKNPPHTFDITGSMTPHPIGAEVLLSSMFTTKFQGALSNSFTINLTGSSLDPLPAFIHYVLQLHDKALAVANRTEDVILRKGDGVLGTFEDVIEVVTPPVGPSFPTGVNATRSAASLADPANLGGQLITFVGGLGATFTSIDLNNLPNFDYTTGSADPTKNPFDVTKLEFQQYNANRVIETTMDLDLKTGGDVKTYILDSKLP